MKSGIYYFVKSISLLAILMLTPFALQADLADLIEEIGGEVVNHKIDKKIKIKKMKVVERFGNRVILDIQYNRVYRPTNVDMEAYVLSGGNELDGFESTVANIVEANGEIRLTVSWIGAELGVLRQSDQIKIALAREGLDIKTKVFNFKKDWTALDEVEENELADGSSTSEVWGDDEQEEGQEEGEDGQDGGLVENIPVTVIPPASVATNVSCHDVIQGNIPWNYQGSKTWAQANIDRLCKGATDSSQPGVCFDMVMHSGINYGGGTKWQWQNAVDLCEGTRNANTTIQCFKNSIARGKPWKTAIASCDGRPAILTQAQNLKPVSIIQSRTLKPANIIWQNKNGQVHYWSMKNGKRTGGFNIHSPVIPDWKFKAAGDVNGDGTDDIIWQNKNGQIHYWPMKNGKRTGGINVHTPVATAVWSLRAAGDVNGDGTDDIIWQNKNGQIHYWPMKNGKRTGGINVHTPVATAVWSLRAAGDVNGDGTDDIIWQNKNGQIHYWPMKNGKRVGGTNIHSPVAPEWKFKAAGDVNRDGTDDIIWQFKNGQVHYWPMKNGKRTGGFNIHMPVDASWKLKAVGNLN